MAPWSSSSGGRVMSDSRWLGRSRPLGSVSGSHRDAGDRPQPLAGTRTPRKAMRRPALFIAIAQCVLAASPLTAQHRSPLALDVTLGLHTVVGGLIDLRTGLLFDALLTGRVRTLPRRTLVAGVGASTVFGGSGDRCLPTPGGGCASQGNFVVLNALVGFDQPIENASVRLLVGPAVYDGAGGRSTGLHGRVDLASPPFFHVALGAMASATLLPSHNRQTLRTWAAGLSLALR